MVLFADVRETRYTVEFFNSSGNSPDAEWVNWMVKTKAGIENLIEKGVLPKKDVEILKVSNIRHQKSKSECGLYALFYIWMRLNGVPPEYFATTPVPDQHMFEFRQHLFNDRKRQPSIKKFHWETYRGQVNIKWE
jgi:catalase